jgi:hypothetical protein
MAIFSRSGLFTAIAFASSLSNLAPAQQPKSVQGQGDEQPVYTMSGKYKIEPQGDGKTYLLLRLAKDGSAYETVTLTRSAEKNGEIVYVDQAGKTYTTLVDGRLQEKLALDATPAVQPPSSTRPASSAPQLMTAPPVVPRNTSDKITRVGSFTPSPGESLLRTAGGLVFLTTGIDRNGFRHEVVVQKVSDQWYIRTSISGDPGEAPAFRLEGDGSISGFSHLPYGVPQVATINREGNPAPVIAAAKADSAEAWSPLPAQEEPAAGSQLATRRVEYEGRKGRLLAFFDARGPHTFLYLDGQAGPVAELEPVRGSTNLFTIAGRDQIFVVVNAQSILTVSDAGGQPASLGGIQASIAPAPVRAAVDTSFADPPPPAVPRPDSVRAAELTMPPPSIPDGRVALSPAPTAPLASPPPAAAYSGPMSGTLECDGHPIPQNAEQVFLNLPPAKLQLTYDANTWDTSLVPSGQTQKLILRNKKPGSQKKCTVHWKVAP